jgi:predicted nucleic-acid-binding protein
MIGLDTNVLIRYLTQDDARQARIANRTIDNLTVEQPGFVGVVTLVELFWVLRRTYGFEENEVIQVLADMLAADEFVIENPAVVRRALDAAAEGADLADALIAESARLAGCDRVVTFDRRTVKAAGMHLLR